MLSMHHARYWNLCRERSSISLRVISIRLLFLPWHRYLRSLFRKAMCLQFGEVDEVANLWLLYLRQRVSFIGFDTRSRWRPRWLGGLTAGIDRVVSLGKLNRSLGFSPIFGSFFSSCRFSLSETLHSGLRGYRRACNCLIVWRVWSCFLALLLRQRAHSYSCGWWRAI